MKKLFAIIIVLSITLAASAQTTVVLQPDTDGIDALLSEYESNVNYGAHEDIQGNAWTFSGTSAAIRGLLKFDLSSIPASANIVSASLTLSPSIGSTSGPHSTQSGDNDCYLKRVTANWNESTVTWNTQPATTNTDEVYIPASTGPLDAYTVDVTPHVQYWVNTPANNFGLLLSLVTEQHYRRMNFASSDNDIDSIHPKLEITYTLPCIMFNTDSSNIDAIVSSYEPAVNYGDHKDLQGNAWTFNGTPGIIRSFMWYDFSSLPANAVIASANLSLYGSIGSTSGNHSTQSGANNAVIEPVISAWDEHTIIWNNQPGTDASTQVAIAASTSALQNYVVDIAPVVQSIVNSGDNFGFALKLETEQHYRRLTFGSSDNPNVAIRPSLEVCYTVGTGATNPLSSLSDLFTVYPIPANNEVNIYLPEHLPETSIEVFSISGQLMYRTSVASVYSNIDVSNLQPGTYFIKINDKRNLSPKRFIKG